MRQKVVLVTGANGEIGHGLIQYLAESTDANIVALDVVPLDKNLRPYCSTYIVGDILDQMLLGRMVVEHEIATIYHLASIRNSPPDQRGRYPEPAQVGRRTIAVAGLLGKIHLPQLDCSLWDSIVTG